MASVKRKSLLGRIISILLIFILIVVALAVGGYFYLKNNLGIDVIDLKNKIDLLNRPVNESNVVTNGFNNEDISSAFLKISGSSDVYEQNAQGEYVFNKASYEAGSLQIDCVLTDKELAGIVSTMIKNYTFSELNIDEQFRDLIEIKELSFKNLSDEVTHKNIQVSYVICVNLLSIKSDIEDIQIVSLLNRFIPKNIYIKSNISIDVNEGDSKNYSVSTSSFTINELNTEESKKVLSLFDFIDNSDFSSVIIDEVNSVLCDFLFGTSDYAGLLNSFNGSSSFGFSLNENSIVLSIKK